jgi:hypothetical protein
MGEDSSFFETTNYIAQPSAASKLEIRISKYETNSNDKKLKFKTKYKLSIINKLQQALSNIEQKEQEIERL